MASDSPQLKSLKAWIKSLESLDAGAIQTRMTDDYQYYPLPSSIGPDGADVPPLSKEQYGKQVAMMFTVLFESVKIEVLDIVEQPGKIALQGKTTGKMKSGEIHVNEYIWIVSFEKGGEDPKITQIKDFLDSHKTKSFKWPEVPA